jgi:predicted RNase H-like nuclease (RuvC/YqgF family)
MENHITEYNKKLEEKNKELKKEIEGEKSNTELFQRRLKKAIKEHAEEIEFVIEDKEKEILILKNTIEELKKEIKNTQREYLNKGKEEAVKVFVLLEEHRAGGIF